MKYQFNTPRRVLLGSTPKGPEYMESVNYRVKRMEAATCPLKDKGQAKLPYAPALKP